MRKYERKTGTKEWSEVSKNLFIGCKHNCKYCYGKIQTPSRARASNYNLSWEIMTPTLEAFEKPKFYENKQIMFPTLHDIFPEHLSYTVKYLTGLLKVGNRILIVSKPHYEVITELCRRLSLYKEQIIFRFSIGSINQEMLELFEPNAPKLDERINSLKYAYEQGFETSVSCEPRYDIDMIPLITKLMPYVTESIWIGQLNHIDDCELGEKEKEVLSRVQSEENTMQTYRVFKDNQKIKWKYEVRKIIEENQ
jgi:DNA repair photolyase